MEGVADKIQTLLETGNNFTYNNFSIKSPHGYPSAFIPAYVSWKSRVSGAIRSLFGADSAQMEMLRLGDSVRVLGNGSDKFESAHGYYLGALDAAAHALGDDTFGELIQKDNAIAPMANSKKVFVVHGRDEQTKQDLEILLGEMGLEPVVLHRQPDGGKTIIEKFEQYSDVGYAFILMTPDETASLVGGSEKENNNQNQLRARPNVIFEFGYFVGKLGRHRTCCLIKGELEIPSDLHGLVYKRFNVKIEEVGYAIGKELKAAGYIIK